MSYFYGKPKPGFTVLEFLIAIGIITLLISLVIVGLTRARSGSRDQELVTKLQNVAIGVEQFHDICKEYPVSLTGTETCPALDNQGNKTIKDLIQEIAELEFNDPDSRFRYAGMDTNGFCGGFHMGVRLDNAESAPMAQKSAYNSLNDATCDASGDGFDGESEFMFDIKK